MRQAPLGFLGERVNDSLLFRRNKKTRRKRYDACDELVREEGLEPSRA